MAPSLTDDNTVLAQKAGAVFTVNSTALYQVLRPSGTKALAQNA